MDTEYFQNRYTYASYAVDPLGALNLFSVKTPIWTNMRHELTPMFTSMRLKTLMGLMNINAKELGLKIQRDYIDRKLPVNLKELFLMYTSDTVGYTVFGLRVSALNDPSSPLWYITRHMVKWTFWRGFEFIMIFFVPAVAILLRFFKLVEILHSSISISGEYETENEAEGMTLFSQPATEYIKKLFWDVVKERERTGRKDDKDLINHLLKLKANLRLPAEADTQMADDLMLAQAAVFIMGAIDTSSTTITYCLQELAHHPEEQQKLYEEVDGAMRRTGKEVLEYEDLLELKYLTCCINETLRKYPPASYLDRICNKSYKLNDETTVEENTPVFVNVLALHYDEQFYPEPEDWRPERMTAASESDNLQFHFLPFGDGPRHCIGRRYGLMQIRAAIAQMITKYKFEPVMKEPYLVDPNPYSVFLAPRSGGSVKFVVR